MILNIIQVVLLQISSGFGTGDRRLQIPGNAGTTLSLSGRFLLLLSILSFLLLGCEEAVIRPLPHRTAVNMHVCQKHRK